MTDFPIAEGGGILVLIVIIVGAVLVFLRPRRHEGIDEVELPDEPDTSRLDREIGAADSERDEVEQDIDRVEQGEQPGAADTLNDLLGR